jgi:hypothetical protein
MIKERVKQTIKKPLSRAFNYTFNKNIRLLNQMSPVLATKVLHRRVTREFPNLDNPTKFNDKLQWLKLYWNNPLVARSADKYEMYNYVREFGDPIVLNNLLAVYNNVDEIDWDLLPNKFALKCTHGCGYNIVTKDKSELDKNQVCKQLNEWMNEKFGKRSLEFHYDEIQPKIILEKYIENKAGLLPIDYKVYCFNGEPKLVLVCSEREKGLKLDFFDLEWNRLNIGYKKDESNNVVSKPSCFDDMVKHARLLSKPFPFVRVDFYDKDGVAILGELTFTPAANMANYYNDYGQHYLGSLLTLPDKV